MYSADAELSIKAGYAIEFHHIASSKTVYFKGYITSFNDQFSAKWNPESIYGRMDDVMTYQNTNRRISMNWDIVAADHQEAASNLAKIEVLLAMLYPVYDNGVHNTLQASPLIKVKFANLITAVPHTEAEEKAANMGFAQGSDAFNSGGAVAGGAEGLVSCIDGFNYQPDFEPGVFMGQGQILPKVVKMSANFTVLHTQPLGWRPAKKTGEFGLSAGSQRSMSRPKAKWRGSARWPYGMGGLMQKIPGVPNKGNEGIVFGMKQAQEAAITGELDSYENSEKITNWFEED